MGDLHDLRITLDGHLPVVTIESHEEGRVLDLFRRLALEIEQPIFSWTASEGIRRVELDLDPREDLQDAEALLRYMRAYGRPGVFILLDFHHWLDDPILIRLLKDVAMDHARTRTKVVLLSHALKPPKELQHLSASFQLAMPDRDTLMAEIKTAAREWAARNHGLRVRTDRDTLERMINSLRGLTLSDARRLLRNAVFDDGAITADDIQEVAKAKYELLNTDGVLSFEFDTARLSDVGGFGQLKRWLHLRKAAFLGGEAATGLEPPKGVLMVGVQGAGKSLAAKAVAGAWALPLLRLDFGTLYNKYFGETERNLRAALKTASAMAPCVLWIDEIEKGTASKGNDNGTAQRVLGTLLTWMAERAEPVFIVATANDISALPPELIRKGRVDEIFFVDLPGEPARRDIFAIHLKRRDLDPAGYDLPALAQSSEGFSGAEIEQAVVAMLYAARAGEQLPGQGLLEAELARTRPLSVVMAEQIEGLRQWARGRTVPAD
ncbi:MAG: AAA family ATPase [Gammaproteobacteria bacterium]